MQIRILGPLHMGKHVWRVDSIGMCPGNWPSANMHRPRPYQQVGNPLTPVSGYPRWITHSEHDNKMLPGRKLPWPLGLGSSAEASQKRVGSGCFNGFRALLKEKGAHHDVGTFGIPYFRGFKVIAELANGRFVCLPNPTLALQE